MTLPNYIAFAVKKKKKQIYKYNKSLIQEI